MRILITGKNGQVGTELSRRYESRRDVLLTGRDECDLSSEPSIRDAVRRVTPTVIINAGAYTAVDQAEKERPLCFAINAAAPRVLAEEAARLDALLIHYSTDYVFDGTKSGPYVESDPIHPLSVYGESERPPGRAAITEAGLPYLILRTSWTLRAWRQEFPSDHAPARCGTAGIACSRRPGRRAHFSRCHSRSHGAPGRCCPERPWNLSHDCRRLDVMVWLCLRYSQRCHGPGQPSNATYPWVGLSNSCQASCEFCARQRQIRPYLRVSAAVMAAATRSGSSRDRRGHTNQRG